MNIEPRVPGPVEILCKEIDFHFDRSMEAPRILVAFVAQLVGEIARERSLEASISEFTGKPPSEKSAEALRLAQDMVTASDPGELIGRAALVHDFDHINNPEDGNCDHLIDMLSSCASALRFGLETPCHSRHAAAAAQHVWRRLYGIKREDSITPHWSKHWARIQLQSAITSIALKGDEQ